jgi:hypothetical protein
MRLPEVVQQSVELAQPEVTELVAGYSLSGGFLNQAGDRTANERPFASATQSLQFEDHPESTWRDFAVVFEQSAQFQNGLAFVEMIAHSISMKTENMVFEMENGFVFHLVHHE